MPTRGSRVPLRGALALFPQLLDFFLCKVFDSDEVIFYLADADELVEFHLNRGTIAVLGVLTSRMR